LLKNTSTKTIQNFPHHHQAREFLAANLKSICASILIGTF
jgi:hypothetical protein